MAVKIRLKRIGRHKHASYRIVVADSRSPRDGRFIQEIGIYQPVQEANTPALVRLDHEAAKKWLKVEAQPTDTVRISLRNKAFTEFAKKKRFNHGLR